MPDRVKTGQPGRKSNHYPDRKTGGALAGCSPEEPHLQGFIGMANLFAYGTLMCEDIFYSLAQVKLSRGTGILEGYSRHPVAGRVYPGILPGTGRAVRGIIYLDLPDELWSDLDRFEGEMYERCPVKVECPPNRKVTAWAYVVRPQFASCLEHGKHWDFYRFLAGGKKIFQQSYDGYGAVGRLPDAGQ